MGEKLLARRLLQLLRATIGSSSREAAQVTEWCSDQRDWLWPGENPCDLGETDAKEIKWADLPALLDRIDAADPEGSPFDAADHVADLLQLPDFDRELLKVAVGFRLPRISSLRSRLAYSGLDLVTIAGQLAGADSAAAARVRRSKAISFGLLKIERDGAGPEVQVEWSFARLLDEGLGEENRLIEALAGKRQVANLGRSDFIEIADELDLMVRLLKGALSTRARGVNILIHGPPGTGKTELARTLAAEAGAALFAVGEADEDGDEPSRHERLHSLHRAQRLMSQREGCVLLFDEMEDLFAEASWSASGTWRSGSKLFVNRLLEDGAVPTIWTTNSLACIDTAHLRRLNYILKLDHAAPKARVRIAQRAGEAEGAADAVQGLGTLLTQEPESASVARVALRTAALAGGRADDAGAAGRSLLLGLRGGRSLAPAADVGSLDLSLYQANHHVGQLIERLSDSNAPSNFSLLLTGPPGTGKTALAAHLARRLDRPLSVKRTSDLLSKWVGETEANIADAFAEARDSGSVLLFDEADSLLQDRSDARQSWEITQVNEMLTWMDMHPLPFIAATNFERRLDPAAMRRFVFKLALETLAGPALSNAFERFFGHSAPRELHRLVGLTPGDFAVVRRQFQFRGPADDAALLALLQGELDAKPGQSGKLGF